MISWIQNHLIRHGRWIFISLLAVIIIAFVFTIGNTPGLTTDDSKHKEIILFGIDLNNPRVKEELSRTVGLSYFLRTKSEIRNDNQLQSEALNRITQLYLIENIGLPNPSQDELKKYIESLAYFQDETGVFDSESYNNFIINLNVHTGLSEKQFVETMIEDYKIDSLNSVIEGPGFYISPQIKFILDEQNKSYNLYNIKIDPRTFDPDIDTSEEAIKAYFETQKVAYETDERIKTSFILFPLVEEIPEADTNTLKNYYKKNKNAINSEYLKNKEAVIDLDEESSNQTANDDSEEDITYELVADIVKANWINEKKNKATENLAYEFIETLANKEIELESEAFNNLSASYGVSATDNEPYSKSEINGKKLPSKLLLAGFELIDNYYFSDPFKTEDGYIVLFLKGTIPPIIPSFDEVADEVKNDYITGEIRSAFNAYGEELKSQLEAIIASGDDFQSGAEGLGLSVEHYPDFSYNNQPEGVNPYEFQAVLRLNEGEVSNMSNYSEVAIITYLESISVKEYEVSEVETERIISNIKGFSKNVGLSGLYNELLTQAISDLEPSE